MAEYIDREAAKDVAAVALYHATHEENYTPKRLFDALDDIPAADIQPVVHGRWINTMPIVEYKSFCQVKCSICESIEAYGNYCRNCGARMDGEA